MKKKLNVYFKPQFSKPPPNHIFLYKRFRFIRVVTPSKLSNDGLELCTRPVQSTTLPTFLIFHPISMNYFFYNNEVITGIEPVSVAHLFHALVCVIWIDF